MSTTTETQFEVAQEEILQGEIRDYAAQAVEGNESARAEFFRAVEERGAKEALRWKAETLVAAELEADLGKILLHFIEKDEPMPALEAIEHGKTYLQQQVNEGCSSSWSGLFTNEAAKARGIAALSLLSHGTFAYFANGAEYQAAYRVLPPELRKAVDNAKALVRDIEEKISRARTEESKDRLRGALRNAEDALSMHQEHLARAAREAGVPEGLGIV